MGSLNLSNLKANKDEILKAEIISLFSLLEKTFTEWWKKREFFKSYVEQFSDIESELTNLLSSLKEISFNLKIKHNNNFVNAINCFDDFINPDWRSWRKISLKDNPEKFLQVLYGSCEGINSGIEKGSPSENNQISKISDKPFLSTSFGKTKKRIEDKDLNGLKKDLFSENLNNKLDDDLKKLIKNKKILDKNISTILGELANNNISIWKLISLRIRIYNLICLLYKDIPSDSRFPANDTSLFDQAYMSTSLFKASLAGMFLSLNNGIDISNFDGSKIKWSILGIQYDKLGLAEKGLKAASIKWYRDTSEENDNDIKKLLEITYPLGNEVYRDETGIYFIVPENVIGEKQGDFYTLNNDLDKIKSKIQNIFSNNFEGEIYPAVFLTEPSRGLMNLGHLVEKARENFLKAEYPKDFEKNLKYDKKSEQDNDESKSIRKGICQVCGVRLAVADKEKQDLVCDVCKGRSTGRLEDWWSTSAGKETIWLDELQDKNGRVSLVTLKFELGKWLNGDLVNSLMVRDELLRNLNLKLVSLILESKKYFVEDYTGYYENNKEKFRDFYNLFDSAIGTIFRLLINKLNDILNKRYSEIEAEIIQIENDLKQNNLSKNQKNKKLKKKEELKRLLGLKRKILTYTQDNRFVLSLLNKDDGLFEFKDDRNETKIKNQLTFIYFYEQVSNLLLERSIGSQWEELIYKELEDWDNSDNKPLKQKINFDDRKIYWEKLNGNDIKFLSQILLQFLLRKNPSPARLRRIWETTREFFEELESKLVDKLIVLPEERKKRVVITLTNNTRPDGEYEWKGINFWKKGNQIKLISSIEVFASAIGKELENIEEHDLKNLISKAKIVLKSKEDSKVSLIDLSIQSNFDAKLEDYEPYFTILSPTPVSWQFIIPAENLPQLIENVQKEYYKNFKWVYGKLPLHIGIVVQNYKKPLYVGIKALRKIRRDGIEWKKLGKEISAKDFKARQKEVFHYQTPPEKTALCENFYSLFEKIDNEGKYEFYLYPEKKEKVWLDTTQDVADAEKFRIYPNTIDFEFLDTNTRRNDIYYNEKNGKRFLKSKKLRPYDLNDWQYFKKFKEFFLGDEKSSSKLQKLISIIYSKMEDWENDNEALKQFMLSAFVNVLELRDNKDKFAGILGVDKFKELEDINGETFKEKLLMLIDMFEFWHTMLKGGN